MKQKLFLTILFLATGLGVPFAQSQNLLVWQQNGTVNPFEISSLQMFSFSGGILVIKNISGTAESFDLSTVSKLTFGTSTGVESVISTKKGNEIELYYGATNDVVYLKNCPVKTSQVYIYQLNGVLALQTQVSSDDQLVDVSRLSQGFYLLKVNNQVFKFVKQ
jgi:hypothetical protein